MSNVIPENKKVGSVVDLEPQDTAQPVVIATAAPRTAAGVRAAALKKEQKGLRIRIRIKAYDHKVIDTAVRQIIENVEKYGVDIIGPVPLPTEIKKYTVNRSTFVHKNSREQYEMRIHKRLLDILNPNQKVIESLTNLNLPAGVDIEIKL